MTTIAAKSKSEEIHNEALKIEKFRGAEGESWSEWWELYTSIHDDKKLTDERKFLYLRSYIPKDSTAGQLIAGFSPSEYRDAIDLSKENFGQDKKRIRTLQQQLFNMPICTSLEDVRKMYLATERICRQLKGLGQDTDGDHYFNALEGKLTRNMLRDILEAKNRAGDSWTTSDFRKELKTLVESEMEISAILKHAKGDEGQKLDKKAKIVGQIQQTAKPPSVACSAVGGDTKRKDSGNQNWKKQKKKLVKNKEERNNRRFRPIAHQRTFHNRAYRNVRFSISPIRRPSSKQNVPEKKYQKQGQMQNEKETAKESEKQKVKPNEVKMDHSIFREMAQVKNVSSSQEMSKTMRKEALSPKLSYPKELQLAEICKAGIGIHRDCQTLRIDQMLGKHGKSFVMLRLPSFWQTSSLMEMLAVNWAFRNIDCSTIEVEVRLKMLRDFIRNVLRNPKQGLKIFEEEKSKLKGTSKIDGDWPLEEISWLLLVRKKHCRLAADAFDKDCHKAVEPASIAQMPEASAELTTFLANRLARALTDLRANEFYAA